MFTALAMVAASRLYDPFSGDQALFLVGAMKMHAGAAYYRDFWDLKQPGIYAFFLAAGSTFGFDQIGIHLADLVWQLSFSVLLIIAFWKTLRYPPVALFAPIAVVGAYYAGSSSWHLLQVEALVGLPLFCNAWFAIAATQTSSRPRASWLFAASGAACGIVLIFKAFLGIVALAIVAAVIFSTRGRGRRGAFEGLAFWVCGAAVPIGICAIVLSIDRTLPIALATTFVVPYEIVTTVSHAPFARLCDSAMRLLLYYRGIILLGSIGLFAERDARSRPWRIACAAWLGAGTLAIVLQVESWWQYHFLLLVPPIGMLATFGFDVLANVVSKGRMSTVLGLAAAGFVAYVAVPLPQGAIGTILRVARERPFQSPALLERYRVATSPEYAISLDDATALRKTVATRAPIYVFGEPLIYLILDRKQAIAMNGWGPQIDTPALWQKTYDELCATRPADIFVNEGFTRYLGPALSGAIPAFLDRNYSTKRRTTDGTWFALRTSAIGTEARASASKCTS